MPEKKECERKYSPNRIERGMGERERDVREFSFPLGYCPFSLGSFFLLLLERKKNTAAGENSNQTGRSILGQRRVNEDGARM